MTFDEIEATVFELQEQIADLDEQARLLFAECPPDRIPDYRKARVLHSRQRKIDARVARLFDLAEAMIDRDKGGEQRKMGELLRDLVGDGPGFRVVCVRDERLRLPMYLEVSGDRPDIERVEGALLEVGTLRFRAAFATEPGRGFELIVSPDGAEHTHLP